MSNAIDSSKNNHFSNCMLVFLAFGLDVVVSLIVANTPLKDVLYCKAISNLITSILWAVSIYISYKYFIKKEKISIHRDLDLRAFIYFVLISIAIILINIYVKGQDAFHIVKIFNRFNQRYLQYGLITYIAQNIYYLLESMLIVIILIIGQQWGELKYNSKRLPYGGVMLSLTWGALHIITQDLLVGIFCIIISLLLGTGFLMSKKNIYLAYIMSLLIFWI